MGSERSTARRSGAPRTWPRTAGAIACALCAAALLLAPPAAAAPTAADRETARHLMKEGDRKAEAKDYAGALKDYEAAHAIMGVPTTGLAVARTRIALEQLIEARELLLQIARSQPEPGEPAPLTTARQEAADLAEKLGERIPSMIITVQGGPSGAEVELTIDGQVVPSVGLNTPRKINPGPHVVAVSSEGLRPATQRVTVKEGETRRVTLKLEGGAGAGPGGDDGGGKEGGGKEGGGKEGGGEAGKGRGNKISVGELARYREGVHVGLQAGPSMALLLDGPTLFGATGGLLLNIGLTPQVDLRTGVVASFHGARPGVLLAVGPPLLVRVNLSSRFAMSGGLTAGYGTGLGGEGGFVGGPEWSALSLRLGDRRQFELDFSQGFRFGATPAEYHHAFVLTYLFLDDEAF